MGADGLGPSAAGGEGVRVRPAGAVPEPRSAPHGGVSMLVYRSQQQTRISKFSGNKSDWARWKQEFLNYIKILTMGVSGPDFEGMNMALAENMDEATVQL